MRMLAADYRAAFMMQTRRHSTRRLAVGAVATQPCMRIVSIVRVNQVNAQT